MDIQKSSLTVALSGIYLVMKTSIMYNSLVQADGLVGVFSKLKAFVASTNKTPSAGIFKYSSH